MIRAVIDTNVLVSGLLSPAGNEALIVLAIHQGFVRPCLSEPIIAEYAAVLARPKFAFPPEEIEAVLAMLQNTGEIFHPRNPRLFPPIQRTPSFCIAPRQQGRISSSPATSGTFPMRPTVLTAWLAPVSCSTASRLRCDPASCVCIPWSDAVRMAFDDLCAFYSNPYTL